MRIFIYAILLLSALFFRPDYGWTSTDLLLNLDAMIEEALSNNPELNAARNNIHALAQRPDQADTLPNPMVSLGLMNLPLDTFELDQEGMTQKTIGIMQRFPYPGKLALKREMAEHAIVGSREELEVLKLKLVAKVKKSYYSLFFINKTIEITERNKGLLAEFIRIAETKYSVGSGIQQDVIKAQVELSKLLENLIILNTQKETLKAELNYLMNRLPQDPLGDPYEIELTSVTLLVEKLQEQAESNHPALKRILSIIEKNRSDHLLSKKEYYPDFNVTVQYGQRDDGAIMNRPDFVSAMVMMKIPLWHKTKEDKKVVEKASRIKQAEMNYEKARSMLFFRIKKLKENIIMNYDQAMLFRDGIIPQAMASLDSAIAGYQVNKVNFMTLLNNQITLFKYEIEYFRTIVGHEKKLAEMEAMVGLPIAKMGLKSSEPENALPGSTETEVNK